MSAEAVVPSRTRVAGTIRLTTGLDPHKRVGKLVTSAARWSHTEAGAVDVAPVTP